MADLSVTKNRLKTFPYQVLDGAKVPLKYDLQKIRDVAHYIPKEEDIFIVSYPKCGTTWVQYIVYLLRNDTQNPNDVPRLITRIPYVERDGFPPKDEQIFAFKSHLPPDMIPFSPKAKYIYVARNVMDTAVSYYHFFKSIPHYLSQDLSFDDSLESFLSGDCLCGDYFEHLATWYERRDDPNVLFLTYESMKNDHRGAVIKIAHFIGKDVTGTNEKLLDDVLTYSHVSYMKKEVGPALNVYVNGGPLYDFSEASKLVVNAKGKNCSDETRGTILVRKGKIGDWKENFTQEQKDRTIAQFLKKTRHTDAYRLWPEIFEDTKIQQGGLMK